jgi:hypothetical protein
MVVNAQGSNKRPQNALSKLERQLLSGQTPSFEASSLGEDLRFQGLIAIAAGQDLQGLDLFRRSRDAFNPDSLERAISERLYGLALIRVQREVEGTFALERADAILERERIDRFSLD